MKKKNTHNTFAWDLRIFVGWLAGWLLSMCVCVAHLDAWLVCRLLLFCVCTLVNVLYICIYESTAMQLIELHIWNFIQFAILATANVVCSGFYPTLRVSHMCPNVFKSLKFKLKCRFSDFQPFSKNITLDNNNNKNAIWSWVCVCVSKILLRNFLNGMQSSVTTCECKHFNGTHQTIFTQTFQCVTLLF